MSADFPPYIWVTAFLTFSCRPTPVLVPALPQAVCIKKGDLVCHQCVHFTARLFRCNQCDKLFKQSGNLSAHMHSHSDLRPFICETCGTGFDCRWKLIRHNRSHTCEKPYKCTSCDLAFTQKWLLTNHQRTHSGERPYKCELCGLTFAQNSVLFVHKRTHSGEKPYICEHCGKRFPKRDNLTKHGRIHTGEKPYKCGVCDKSFREKSTLRIHHATHSGSQAFMCELCGQTFSLNRYFLKHVRARHNATGDAKLRSKGHRGSSNSQTGAECSVQRGSSNSQTGAECSVQQGSSNSQTAAECSVQRGSSNSQTAAECSVQRGSSNSQTTEKCSVQRGSSNSQTTEKCSVQRGSSNSQTTEKCSVQRGSSNSQTTEECSVQQTNITNGNRVEMSSHTVSISKFTPAVGELSGRKSQYSELPECSQAPDCSQQCSFAQARSDHGWQRHSATDVELLPPSKADVVQRKGKTDNQALVEETFLSLQSGHEVSSYRTEASSHHSPNILPALQKLSHSSVQIGNQSSVVGSSPGLTGLQESAQNNVLIDHHDAIHPLPSTHGCQQDGHNGTKPHMPGLYPALPPTPSHIRGWEQNRFLCNLLGVRSDGQHLSCSAAEFGGQNDFLSQSISTVQSPSLSSCSSNFASSNLSLGSPEYTVRRMYPSRHKMYSSMCKMYSSEHPEVCQRTSTQTGFQGPLSGHATNKPEETAVSNQSMGEQTEQAHLYVVSFVQSDDTSGLYEQSANIPPYEKKTNISVTGMCEQASGTFSRHLAVGIKQCCLANNLEKLQLPALYVNSGAADAQSTQLRPMNSVATQFVEKSGYSSEYQPLLQLGPTSQPVAGSHPLEVGQVLSPNEKTLAVSRAVVLECCQTSTTTLEALSEFGKEDSLPGKGHPQTSSEVFMSPLSTFVSNRVATRSAVTPESERLVGPDFLPPATQATCHEKEAPLCSVQEFPTGFGQRQVLVLETGPGTERGGVNPSRQPEQPENPGQPGHLGQSGCLGQAWSPGQSGFPGELEHPGKPRHPGHPEQSEHPGLLGQPKNPGQPEHPGQLGHNGADCPPHCRLVNVGTCGSQHHTKQGHGNQSNVQSTCTTFTTTPIQCADEPPSQLSSAGSPSRHEKNREQASLWMGTLRRDKDGEQALWGDTHMAADSSASKVCFTLSALDGLLTVPSAHSPRLCSTCPPSDSVSSPTPCSSTEAGTWSVSGTTYSPTLCSTHPPTVSVSSPTPCSSAVSAAWKVSCSTYSPTLNSTHPPTVSVSSPSSCPSTLSGQLRISCCTCSPTLCSTHSPTVPVNSSTSGSSSVSGTFSTCSTYPPTLSLTHPPTVCASLLASCSSSVSGKLNISCSTYSPTLSSMHPPIVCSSILSPVSLSSPTPCSPTMYGTLSIPCSTRSATVDSTHLLTVSSACSPTAHDNSPTFYSPTVSETSSISCSTNSPTFSSAHLPTVCSTFSSTVLDNSHTACSFTPCSPVVSETLTVPCYTQSTSWPTLCSTHSPTPCSTHSPTPCSTHSPTFCSVSSPTVPVHSSNSCSPIISEASTGLCSSVSTPAYKHREHLITHSVSELTKSAVNLGTQNHPKQEKNFVEQDSDICVFGASNTNGNACTESKIKKSKVLQKFRRGQRHCAGLADDRGSDRINTWSRQAKMTQAKEPALEISQKRCRKQSGCWGAAGGPAVYQNGTGKGRTLVQRAEEAGKLDGFVRSGTGFSVVSNSWQGRRRNQAKGDKSTLFLCQVFSSGSKLGTHLLTGECQLMDKDTVTRFHDNQQLFRCDICGKSYSMRKSLTEHKRSHTSERPYKCSVCGKTYAKSGKFAQHKRTHTGEKRYKCSQCEKRFMYQEDLTRHTRTHTGEKPFCCKDCGKCFTLKSSLNRHNRIHSGERPYLCDQCGKQFAHKETLSSHQRVHSGEKPFTCHICHRAFSERGHLKYHCSTHT